MARKQLSEETVYDIYKSTGTLKEIAEKYNVSISTVRRIKSTTYEKYAKIVKKFVGKLAKKLRKNKEEADIEAKKTKETKKSVGKLAEKKLRKKEKVEAKEVKAKTENVKTKDEVAGILFNLLLKYLQPEIAKYLIDNYIVSKKISNLIDPLIVKINEVNDEEYYRDVLTTLIALLLQKTFQQDQFMKLFGENGESKNEEPKKTKNK